MGVKVAVVIAPESVSSCTPEDVTMDRPNSYWHIRLNVGYSVPDSGSNGSPLILCVHVGGVVEV